MAPPPKQTALGFWTSPGQLANQAHSLGASNEGPFSGPPQPPAPIPGGASPAQLSTEQGDHTQDSGGPANPAGSESTRGSWRKGGPMFAHELCHLRPAPTLPRMFAGGVGIACHPANPEQTQQGTAQVWGSVRLESLCALFCQTLHTASPGQCSLPMPPDFYQGWELGLRQLVTVASGPGEAGSLLWAQPLLASIDQPPLARPRHGSEGGEEEEAGSLSTPSQGRMRTGSRCPARAETCATSGPVQSPDLWATGIAASEDHGSENHGSSSHLCTSQVVEGSGRVGALNLCGSESSPRMGTRSQCPALAWALMVLLSAQQAAQAFLLGGHHLQSMGWDQGQTETQGSEEPSRMSREAVTDGQRMNGVQTTPSPTRRLTFIPPITMSPSMSPLNPAHNGRVCSTWGDFHYKTFDGDIFRFPGLCNYVLSSHCRAAYEDFNIQVRRELLGARPTISRIVLKVEGLVLEVANGSVLIDGQGEELPYSRAGLLVERSSSYVKISVRMVLTFLWNGEDSALLELDPKYANQTCGLCGDFNGLPVANEFYAHNVRLTALQFGNLQKLDGPTEQCQDPLPTLAENCTNAGDACRRTLLGSAFAQCNKLVDPDPYVASCAQDQCRCPSCPCATFAEYSRQCAHAGGQPQNWRGPNLCSQTCPAGMQHQECGSPCADTCSNPEHTQLCEDHCEDGCFCPPGTVLDDVTHSGCVPLPQCPCTHGGRTYAPGAAFATSCSSCTCSGGRWQCKDLPCPGTCSVQGGAHITTYDEKLYDLHGDCSYVLSKRCADSAFTVLAELRRCGLTDTESCLKSVTLSLQGGDTVIRIQANGAVFMNSIYTQLPVSAANIKVFRPSSFFVLVQTGLGLQLQVQLVPLMQVYVRLDPAHHGQMCGLCGNFNQNQVDDFTALSGVVEATGAAFANTWKTQAACPNAKNSFEDPCSLSVENEKYAQHWCALLTHPTGAFAPCHSIVNPAPFHLNCMFDTCNCEKSEDCLCAALSAYVHTCAAKGVLLQGWRDGVCTKYMNSCPKSQSYEYVVDTCQPTCRALSEADVTCGVSFVPVDGCTCPVGTYLDDAGMCVHAEECPCYLRGTMVAPGEVLHDNSVVCSCTSGKLSCLGALEQRSTGCVAPMVYMDCTNASAGSLGAECLRSCHTLDVDCYSTHCVSGCVCPTGLVSDGSGGCVAQEDCPCVHNEATYQPGDTIRVDCNTCTCRNRRWECSSQPCLGTCVAYGDGHFITFDGERYSFEGSCEYMLAQDYCGGTATTNGTFRIVTENIPCGTTGVTCSKAIKLFLESYELILMEGHLKVVERGPGGDLPYKIRYMGIYLVIEIRSGLVVSWDRKTSIFIRLHPGYKGKVCGLCGNFDGNAINDFTTRSQSVVGDVLEFGNSWKFSPSCPDARAPRDPCTANPYRKSWAQKQCSILHGATFAACQSQVDSTKYYEACVSDACACDSGGDCECFCTAVAAYAQACHDAGVCVSWRSPEVCPLFCDYYNPRGECEWHYQPCGAPCMRTCRNPSGRCLLDLPGLEGCYPKCPPSKPFFSEDQMKCVAQCGCYDEEGNYYEVSSKVATAQNCQSCTCTTHGIQCDHSLEACTCTYEGRTYGYQDVIYNTTDGLGACLVAICGDNGTIHRKVVECSGTPPTTPFAFTTTAGPPTKPFPFTTAAPESTAVAPTVCVLEVCSWSNWYDGSRPEPGMGGGDFETFVNLRQRGYQVCEGPADIQCRAEPFPDMPLEKLGQRVDCDRARGLTCLNQEQSPPLCHNYQLRVLCCALEPCSPSTTLRTSPRPFPSVTTQPGATTETPVPTPRAETFSPMSLPTPTQIISTRETTLQSTPNSNPTRTLTLQTQSTSAMITLTQSLTSSKSPGATTCQLRCQWTEWFDVDYPKSEEAGGDIESYDKIRRAGGDICEQPQDIECQAENLPNSTLQQVGQRVHCDASFGLVCRNNEQKGPFQMCYNYRIRVLCCSHCGGHTTIPPTQTPLAGTTTAPFPSTGPTFQPSSTNTLTTSTTGGTGTEAPTSPPGSPTLTSPKGSTLVPPTHTTLHATTGSISTWGTSQVSTPVSTARTSLTELPSAGTSPGAQSTSSKASQLTTTTATTGQGPTRCQPRCEWTEWFDVDFPTSGVSGGDMETFDNIRAAGGKMCNAPEQIECRAENYPEVSLDQIGQVLRCSLQEGLVCRNKDQQGPFNMCFNYNVRVLCCDDYQHCRGTEGPTSTPALTITSTSMTERPTSTPTSTSKTAGPMSTPAFTPTSSSTTAAPETTPIPTSSTTTTKPFSSSKVPEPSTSATTNTHLTSPGTTEWVTVLTTSQPTTETLTTTAETTTTTARSASPSAPSTSALTTTPIGTTQGSMPTLETTIVSSPPTPGTFTSTSPTPPVTGCEPSCTWTDWFDESYPIPGPSGGDFETYDNLRAAGITFCERPVDIQCRSESQPQVPLSKLGQVVQCDLTVGLVCLNRDQSSRFQICHNYHVRVLCCDSHCQTTPHTTTMSPTVTSRVPGSSSPPSTTALPLPSTSPLTPSTGPTSAPTRCQRTCYWTDWLDSDQPQPGRYGGDIETYYHIKDTGGQLCEEPVAIECEAVLYPGVPMEVLGQSVLCNVEFGLICRNHRQTEGQTCLNYHVRVQCCNDYSHCGTTAGPTTTPTTVGPRSTVPTAGPTSTTTGPMSTITTVGHTSTVTTAGPRSTTTPTPITASPATTETPVHTRTSTTAAPIPTSTATTEVATPTTTSTTTLTIGPSTSATTQTRPISPGTTEWITVLTTYKPTPETTTAMAETPTTATRLPSPSVPATPALTTTPIGTTQGSMPTLETTIISSPPTPGTFTSTSATPPVTGCEPSCTWTDWFDESYPIPGPSGGDFETYNNLRAAGITFCERPVDIQCRSELQPDRPLGALDQVVQCNVTFGLVCRNREQHMTPRYCHNYHIRMLCCEDRGHCLSTPATTGTTRTSVVGTSRTTPPPSTSGTTSTRTTPPPSTSGATSTRTTSRTPTSGTTSTRTTPPPPTSGITSTRTTSPTPTSRTTMATTLLSIPSTTRTRSTPSSPTPLATSTGISTSPLTARVTSTGTISQLSTTRVTSPATTSQPPTTRVTSTGISTSPLTARVTSTGTTSQLSTTRVTSPATTSQPPTTRVASTGISTSPLTARVTSLATTSQRPTTRVTSTGISTSPITTRVTSKRSTPSSSMPGVTSTGTTLPTPTTRVTSTGTTPQPRTPETTSTLLSTTQEPTTATSIATSTPSMTQTITPTLTTLTPGRTTTKCEPRCTWTDWFDESYPIPGPSGGDFETYDNLRAAGITFCERPVDIQCRSESQPQVPLSKLGQVVQCDLTVGLVCLNRDQSSRFQICHNYHVRVLCCDSHCQTTPHTTTMSPTVTSRVPGSSSPPSTTALPLPSTSPLTPSTGPTSAPTRCQRTCYWTDWLDSDQPQPGRYGGDIETYYHIKDTGGQLCEEPVAIECEAVLYPGVPMEVLGQSVLCNVEFGLICRNHRQTEGQTCLNYHVRVQCCNDYSHCGTTAGPTTTPTTVGPRSTVPTAGPTSTTTGPMSTITTVGHTSTVTTAGPRSTTTPTPITASPATTETPVHTRTSTTAAPIPTSTATTEVTTPTTTSTTTLTIGPSTSATTQTRPISPGTTEWITVLTTYKPTPETTTAMAETPTTATRLPSPSVPATPALTTTPIGTTQGSMPTLETTIISSPPTPGTFTSTSATPPVTGCEPSCTWTDWFDESYPIPGPSGGDFETYNNLRAAGITFCERPVDIQCRSELQPDRPLGALDQVVQCNVTFGLVCRNREQHMTPRYCHNYHIRMLCCEDRGHCLSTPATTGTTRTSVVGTSRTTPPPSTSGTTSTRTTPPPSTSGATSTRTTSRTPTSGTTSTRTTPPPPTSGTTSTRTTSPTPTSRTTMATTLLSIPSTTRTRSTPSSPTPLATSTGISTSPLTARVTSTGTISQLSTTRVTSPATTSQPPTTRVASTGISTSPITTRVTSKRSTPSSSMPGVTSTGTTLPTPTTRVTSTGTTPQPRTPETTSTLLSTTQGPTTATSIATSTPNVTQTIIPTLTTLTPGRTTTKCEPRCTWTDWFDESYPIPGPSGGDFETYNNLRAAGITFCERPVDIQCRSELQPDKPLGALDQVVQCNVTFGLVCRNREQHMTPRYCHNYHIRMLCCEDRGHCLSTPATTGTTRTSIHQDHSTTLNIWDHQHQDQTTTPNIWDHQHQDHSTTLNIWDHQHQNQTTTPNIWDHQHQDHSTTLNIWDHQHQDHSTTLNIWDHQHQDHSTTLNIWDHQHQDHSTTLNIWDHQHQDHSTTLNIWDHQHQDHPATPHIWDHQHQDHPATPHLWDHQYQDCPTTPDFWVTSTRTTPSSSTPGVTSTGTTPQPPKTRVTSTGISTSPLTTRVTSKRSTPSSPTPGVTSTGTTSQPPIPETTSTLLSTSQGPTTATSIATPTPSVTLTSTLVTIIPTLTSSTPGRMTTKCEPRCTWTDWFDESYPIPGPSGGDFETYNNLRAAGITFCERPVDIQCRSELQPDRPLGALDQVVQCNVTFGLVCRNREQHMTPRYCHNYHIRMLCCEDRGHCLSTPATTGTTRTSVVGTSRTTPPPSTSGTTSTRTTPPPSTSGATSTRTRPPPPTSGTTSTRTTPPPLTSGTANTRSAASPPTPVATSTVAPPTSLPGTQSSQTPSGLPGSLPTFSVSTSSSPVLTTFRPTSSPSLTSTIRCYCHAFGTLFSPVFSSPGDIVYNKTDGAGCHFYAICNQQCDINRFQGSCSTTSPPASSSSMAPSSTPVTTPQPSPAPGCNHTTPPRQVNETWTLPDCTVARCEGDNHIILLEPKPVANITCANQHQPVKVVNQSYPCDYHYECECICTGWGGSHYSTFDGTTFSFLGNCTYVLLREIRPHHGNLSILIDYQYCAAAAVGATRCTRALLIYYLSMEIVLTVTERGGEMHSLILFEGERVSQGFSKNGVSISETVAGTMGVVDIPAIGAYISFNGNFFQARLSYSQFSHNTEGQCGTCTNRQVDDCRRPDGTMAPTCKDMAHHWLVPDGSKEGCLEPTTLPSTTTSTPPVMSTSSTKPTSTSCPPAPLCELILSPIFAECHSLVPPSKFFSACVSDGCLGDHPKLYCESLEAYAALCRTQGVCSDWRNATRGLCDLTCPPTKVYKPCGPVHPETCNSRNQSPLSSGLAEGCFCPDGETLFNAYTGVCVPKCTCVGPDGYPKFPGDQWFSNCQACECEKSTVTVQCRPVQCEAQEEPRECSRAGFVNVIRPRANNPCCPETLCVCNTTACPQDPPKCEPGFELIRTQEQGGCCPTFHCWPQFCTYNGTFYGVGATFPGVKSCHTCTCLSRGTEAPDVLCEEDACNTTCPQGFQYRKATGHCCGDCEPIACLTPDRQPVQPNDTWVNRSVDNCTEYRCEAVDGRLVLVPQPAPCPEVSTCRGVLRKSGCCYSCEEVDKCQVRVNRTVLRHRDCETEAAVSLTFCEGSCPGVSKYSAEAQAMERHCACCQETRTHEEAVTMWCPDGTRIWHTYIHVDECSCSLSCVPTTVPQAPMDSSTLS
ncbi:mucin-5B [Loxodonta africana]|uniref:mucin-5B n=1 Tax=Loxodonta africana TaxID=9785 RepID=UPI0030D57199